MLRQLLLLPLKLVRIERTLQLARGRDDRLQVRIFAKYLDGVEVDPAVLLDQHRVALSEVILHLDNPVILGLELVLLLLMPLPEDICHSLPLQESQDIRHPERCVRHVLLVPDLIIRDPRAQHSLLELTLLVPEFLDKSLVEDDARQGLELPCLQGLVPEVKAIDRIVLVFLE